MISSRKESLGLPNGFSAAKLACDCFDIGLKDLQRSLLLLRSNELEPALFPKNVRAQTIKRAQSFEGKKTKALQAIAMHAVYIRALREDSSPTGPMRAHFAQELVRTLVFFHERLVAKLHVSGMGRRGLLRVLVEDVFLPLVYVKLETVQNPLHRNPEFDPANCWYLPRKESDGTQFPFQRVLRLWMHSTGRRYAYDFGKDGNDGLRRNIENWLSGKSVPSPSDIWDLVNSYHGKDSDLGSAQDWKARLFLASAASRLWKRVDEYFAPELSHASLHFAARLADLRGEGVAIDAGNELFDVHTFFAARLLQRRWFQTREWSPQAIPSDIDIPCESIGAGIVDPDVAASDLRVPVFPGDRCLDYMMKQIRCATNNTIESAPRFRSRSEAIFDLGVEEMNRILRMQKASE
jgi:hypothetical protein